MVRVFGTVRNEDGTAVTGVTMKAIDKDLRSEQPLGEGTTNVGAYAISYPEDQFPLAEKKQADLIVRAFDAEGNLPAEPSIVFNAHEEEQVAVDRPHQMETPVHLATERALNVMGQGTQALPRPSLTFKGGTLWQP